MAVRLFQVQRDGFHDLALRLFQGLALSVTTGQSRNDRYLTSFGRLFVIDRIGEVLEALLFITFIVGKRLTSAKDSCLTQDGSEASVFIMQNEPEGDRISIANSSFRTSGISLPLALADL